MFEKTHCFQNVFNHVSQVYKKVKNFSSFLQVVALRGSIVISNNYEYSIIKSTSVIVKLCAIKHSCY